MRAFLALAAELELEVQRWVREIDKSALTTATEQLVAAAAAQWRDAKDWAQTQVGFVRSPPTVQHTKPQRRQWQLLGWETTAVRAGVDGKARIY